MKVYQCAAKGLHMSQLNEELEAVLGKLLELLSTFISRHLMVASKYRKTIQMIAFCRHTPRSIPEIIINLQRNNNQFKI